MVCNGIRSKRPPSMREIPGKPDFLFSTLNQVKTSSSWKHTFSIILICSIMEPKMVPMWWAEVCKTLQKVLFWNIKVMITCRFGQVNLATKSKARMILILLYPHPSHRYTFSHRNYAGSKINFFCKKSQKRLQIYSLGFWATINEQWTYNFSVFCTTRYVSCDQAERVLLSVGDERWRWGCSQVS